MNATLRSISWRDSVAIIRNEIGCVLVIMSDVLSHRDATEPDWNRLALAYRRLNALMERL